MMRKACFRTRKHHVHGLTQHPETSGAQACCRLDTGLMSKLYYIMGKSATGKDHIYEMLLSDPSLGLKPFVIYTTRPMRKNEEDGREYFFRDQDFLEQQRAAGKIIEERLYHTVQGPWYYFTADDGQITDGGSDDHLGIGTLESYCKLVRYFGADKLVPLYIETGDGFRIERALKREKKQENPDYREMCRRFLADSEDFSEDKLEKAGIRKRFQNNDTTLEEVAGEIRKYILSEKA